MKKGLIKIIVLSALLSLNCCGGGIKLPTDSNSKGNNLPTETPFESKTWTEDFTTGHSNKYDIDRALDINQRYSYDILVGFNSYDISTQKAKITFKTINEPYDGEIQRSDPPKPTPFNSEIWIEYLLAGESRKYDTDKKVSGGERCYDALVKFNGWDSSTKKANITFSTIHESYTGY